LHHENAPSYTSFFTSNDCLFPPTLLFLFPQLKTKLKGCHFDTVEVIEAESQVVLNTLTEHAFQDAFKKWKKHWGWCICMEGNYFKGDGGH
jgi:hypothetical protein